VTKTQLSLAFDKNKLYRNAAMRFRPLTILLLCICILQDPLFLFAHACKVLQVKKLGHVQLQASFRDPKHQRASSGKRFRVKKPTHKVPKNSAHSPKFQRDNLYNNVLFPVSSRVLPDSLRELYIRSDNNVLKGEDVLRKLKKKNEQGQVVRIVHMGDSHIQAGILTQVVRHGLQERYGNAGRGLVFPYQLASTSSPRDIVSYSSERWVSARLAKPSTLMDCGVSGFVIGTDASEFYLEIGLRTSAERDRGFDRIRLFASNRGEVSVSENKDASERIVLSDDELTGNKPVDLPGLTEKLLISRRSENTGYFTFYGVSLEKRNTSGIIYDSIGVNGAKYESFNRADLFWQQIGLLDADCYIVSLGTNDAQNLRLSSKMLSVQVRKIVQRIKDISPKAVIVLTTPPPSYYLKMQYNELTETVAEVIRSIAKEENVYCWDLYQVVDGATGAKLWREYALFSKDLIHFTRAGYELQGTILLNAIIQAIDK
jgi:lysophospholipase L1-like esterase